jgi:ribosomal protein S18 acetylase RimI-like enzyme
MINEPVNVVPTGKAAQLAARSLPGRLRKMNLGEFDAMLDLVELAFVEDEAREGRSIRDDMSGMRSMLPFLKLVMKVAPGMEDRFYTLVWEIDGRFISLVTVSQQGNDKGRWYIFNVSTHPDYRGRGLARRIVSAAIDHIRSRHGKRILLDVRSDNEPAYNLYRSLGFLHLESNSEFKGSVRQEPGQTLPDGYSSRPLKSSEWQPRYELERRLATPEMNNVCPPTPDQFQSGRFMRGIEAIVMRAQGFKSKRLLVERADQPVGFLNCTIRVKGDGPHRLSLTLDPAHTAVAAPLIARAFKICADRQPDRTGHPILVTLGTHHAQPIEYLKQLGFEEIEVTHTLGISLV